MKSRYFVAIPVPRIIESKVRNLHISLISPFFIDNENFLEKIKAINFQPFEASLTGLGVFEQKGKKILYAKVEPAEQCQELADKVKEALGDSIQIDTFPFTGGVVPRFEAHVTLDYDFKGRLPDYFEKLSFGVEEIVVFKEDDGEWSIIK